MVVVMALAWFWVNVQLKTTNPLLAMVSLPLMVQLASKSDLMVILGWILA